jgi:hypothetical protein
VEEKRNKKEGKNMNRKEKKGCTKNNIRYRT